MKKVIVSLAVLVMFLFLIGCLDYKTYDLNDSTETTNDELNLIDEIAEIERQLDSVDNDNGIVDKEPVENNVEEEVLLPELDEVSTDMQIITVKENELIKLNVKVADPDKDKVTYTFTQPLNENGEWKTNYGDAGEYQITLTATDGKLTTEKKIKIVVERVNVPPVIETLKDIEVEEGKVVNFEPKVFDPNNDPVTVIVSEPLKNGNFATDHTSAGEYQIKVTATDGELKTEKSFQLIVNDVNVLPVISGLKDIVVKEGEVVTLKPEVTDLDNDRITLTISDPVGNDGVWETSYVDHGQYEIVVVANDGKSKVTKKITITVEDVNMPPEFVDVSLIVG